MSSHLFPSSTRQCTPVKTCVHLAGYIKIVSFFIYIGWDGYIDAIINYSDDSADKACIIGLDSGVKWTTDQHPNALKLTRNEAETISTRFKRNDFTQFTNEGVYAEGVRYLFLRADENVVTAKKAGYGALNLRASKKAIVIAHTAEGKSQEKTNRAVEELVRYLEGEGY